MTHNEHLEKVCSILDKTIGIAKTDIKKDALLVDDLNMDSMDRAELSNELEIEYNIIIEASEMVSWNTVDDVALTLDKLATGHIVN